jgi:hypothetical protein
MAKPASLPRWAETGGGTPASNIIEPTSGKKDTGYVTVAASPGGKGDVPTSGGLNWFMRLVYKWCEWLDGIAGEAWTWTANHIFQASVTLNADPTTGREASPLRMLAGLILDSWTTRTVPTATTSWLSIAYSPDLKLWCLVGSSGCATSPNLVDWTTQTIAAYTWKKVVWASHLGKFVAVGNSSGSCYCTTSADGITWTSPVLVVAYPVDDMAYSPSLERMVVIIDATAVYYSDDAATWTAQSGDNAGGFEAKWIEQMAIFITIGGSGSGQYSADGITWTDITFLTSAGLWRTVAYCDETDRLVAAGDDVWAHAEASDIQTWTSETATGFSFNSASNCKKLGRTVLTAFDGANYHLVHTEDAENWILTPAPVSSSKLVWSEDRMAFVWIVSATQIKTTPLAMIL